MTLVIHATKHPSHPRYSAYFNQMDHLFMMLINYNLILSGKSYYYAPDHKHTSNFLYSKLIYLLNQIMPLLLIFYY